MTPQGAPDTFAGWLRLATRDLPAHLSGVVQEELHGHYRDAYEAHLESGATAEHAHQSALSDLGNPVIVNRDLLEVYISRQHSLIAMLACISYLLMLLAIPTLSAFFGEMLGYLIHDVINTFILIFILLAFVRLIGFHTRTLKHPARLLIGSLVLGTVVRQVYFYAFHQLPLIGAGGGVHWRSGSFLGITLDTGFILAELISSVACAWLALRLHQLNSPFYGLLRPIGALFLTICLAGVGVVLPLFLGSLVLATLFSALGYTLVTILLAVLILAFFRASFRPSREPFKT